MEESYCTDIKSSFCMMMVWLQLTSFSFFHICFFLFDLGVFFLEREKLPPYSIGSLKELKIVAALFDEGGVIHIHMNYDFCT